jgi:hypothetical protein
VKGIPQEEVATYMEDDTIGLPVQESLPVTIAKMIAFLIQP